MQWRLGVTRPFDFVCTGPKYQYQGHPNGDGVHLSATGYQQLGEKVGQVYHQRDVLGKDWRPLQPISVERRGRIVSVRFDVPVPPLDWDGALDPPAIAEWVDGRGFELWTDRENIAIRSVAISGHAGHRGWRSNAAPAHELLFGQAARKLGDFDRRGRTERRSRRERSREQ